MTHIVLAVQTAVPQGSMALLRDHEPIRSLSLGDPMEHSRTVPQAASRLLAEAKRLAGGVDLISVCHGPGSFTGIRVGMAWAMGFGMAQDIPLVGVHSLEALFTDAMQDPISAHDGARCVGVVLGAKKGEFFFQAWYKGRGAWRPRAPRVVPQEDLKGVLAGKGMVVVSPQLSQIRGLMAQAGVAPVWDIKDRLLDADRVGTMGLQRFLSDRKKVPAFKPYYLKDAEAQLVFRDKVKPVFRWERGHTISASPLMGEGRGGGA